MEITILYSYSLENCYKSQSDYGDPEDIDFGCGSSLRDSLRNLGCGVSTFSLYEGKEETGMHRCINAIQKGYNPNFVFLMHAGSLQKGLTEVWDRANFKNIPMLSEGGDEWQCFGYNFPYNSKSDLVLTPDRQCVDEYKTRGVNATWFTHWADERIFFNKDLDRSLDIATTARPTPVRNNRGFLHINDEIKNKFGENFQNPMRNRSKYISMMENGDLFRKSKIVFQFSSCGEITRRIMEGAACGALIVADTLPDIRKLNDLFVENEDIILYSSISECLEKLEYYVNHDEERNRIANNMHQKVMQHHTGHARAKKLLDHYNHLVGN